MTHKHISFPSIEQLKNLIRNVKYGYSFRGFDPDGQPIHDFTAPLPVLEFEGTVKLHGTNAGIVLHPDGSFHCQGRNRILAIGDDNYGFAAYVHSYGIADLLREIFDNHRGVNDTVTVYGEWCGEGIQKGVALAELTKKMFVIFSVRIDEPSVDGTGESVDHWYSPKEIGFDESKLNEKNCYLIDSFPTFKMFVDFNRPELIQNNIISLTEEVERECPVGRAFGVSGIGEGIVWKCVNEPFPKFWFKVKGEKHSVSKVKTLAAVDIEKVNSIIEFSERVVTENRLNQGIEYLKEMNISIDIKSTGHFIRWVYNDVVKEEGDVIVASGLDVADIGKYIAEPSKRWWFKFLEKHNV